MANPTYQCTLCVHAGPDDLNVDRRPQFDDCHHRPDGWKRLTELARSHLEAPLEDCDGSRNQAQEETEEVMSLVVM